MGSPQPPPVPQEAAARAWGELKDDAAPRTEAPPRPLPPPRPPARPSPLIREAPEPATSPKKWLLAMVPAFVVLLLIGVLALRSSNDDPTTGGQDDKGGSAATGPAAPRLANADEIKNKFPLLAARLASLNLQPGRPDPLIIPMPYELRPESTGAGWQFGVEQFFAIRGVDPNRPNDAPAGSTAFHDITIDGFTDSTGATRMRAAYVTLRTSQGHEVRELGDDKKPTRLHREVNGMVTTTILYGSGNTLMRFVSVCKLCSPEDVNREVEPVVRVIQNLFPQGP